MKSITVLVTVFHMKPKFKMTIDVPNDVDTEEYIEKFISDVFCHDDFDFEFC